MNGAIRKTTVHSRNGNITLQSSDIQTLNSPEISNDSNSGTGNSSAAVNEKMCSICLENILQKTNMRDRIFGILLNCNHCFCFTCINHWRGNITNSGRMDRSCPVCRQKIEFIFPSRVWFESNEEKQLYISREKTRIRRNNCQYFRRGSDYCPFGSKCLYLQILPGGIKRDTSPRTPPLGFSEPQMLELRDMVLSKSLIETLDSVPTRKATGLSTRPIRPWTRFPHSLAYDAVCNSFQRRHFYKSP
ncbi:hypothetical protein ABEB36_012301 [Hypothenemus hampei]|uniref:RING-type E3 ubiquitin transferase n=1 Tax=Hypothenemus hampei TaxID=57062 RepID=A0ABD1EAQ9_HYPHA